MTTKRGYSVPARMLKLPVSPTVPAQSHGMNQRQRKLTVAASMVLQNKPGSSGTVSCRQRADDDWMEF